MEYRKLEKNQILQEGDEVKAGKIWIKISQTLIGQRVDLATFRRPLEQ